MPWVKKQRPGPDPLFYKGVRWGLPVSILVYVAVGWIAFDVLQWLGILR
jgi:hypothetical protein